jgi:hypothetical protein
MLNLRIAVSLLLEFSGKLEGLAMYIEAFSAISIPGRARTGGSIL